MKTSKQILRDLSVLLSLVLVLSSVSIGITAAGSGDAPQAAQTREPEASAAAQDDASGLLKNETVYVLADADGTVNQVIVSDWIQNGSGAQSIRDTTNLENIEVTRGESTYVMDGENLCVWDAGGSDVYYEGTSDKTLPVNLSLSFRLDGRPVSAEEAAGKSGRITIRFDYENLERQTVDLDGTPTQMYVPFLMLTGMALPNDSFSNVTVTNGRVINDGSRTLVVGMAMPGMQDNLAIDPDTLEIPDYVEVSADVTDFALSATLTVAASLGSGLELDSVTDAADLEAALQTLDISAGKLTDGMAALAEGITELQEQSGSLTEAVTQLQNLASGAGTVSDSAKTLYAYLQQLNSGLSAVSSSSQALNNGARQTFEALLSSAGTQLAAAGLDVEPLTLDNYDDVLSGILRQLSPDDVYNLAYQTAYATVSASVEACRDAITAQVTAAVREQVLQAVLSAQDLTMEQYNADASVRAAIDAAVDAQMQSGDVQASIAQATEEQIQALIAENMQSDAVQQQIQAAVAQAQAGCSAVQALKDQLDAYGEFYQGVLAYTGGVDAAYAASAQITAGAGKLADGALTLSGGAGALYQGLNAGTDRLLSGVAQLDEGASTVSDGMQAFYSDGIHKLVQLYQDDLSPLLVRLRAMAELSGQYRSFTGLTDGMDGNVKFIYRTDSVEAAPSEENS